MKAGTVLCFKLRFISRRFPTFPPKVSNDLRESCNGSLSKCVIARANFKQIDFKEALFVQSALARMIYFNGVSLATASMQFISKYRFFRLGDTNSIRLRRHLAIGGCGLEFSYLF